MNCFEWQIRSSDYLDGALEGELREKADLHLQQCPLCRDRHQHYRVILEQLGTQPKASLPADIRKFPFSATLPALEVARSTRSRWERVPWFVRTTLEGISIVFLILLGISAGPKLRQFYERRIERSLSEYNEVDDKTAENRKVADTAPLTRGKTQTDADAPAADEFSGEGEDDSEEVAVVDSVAGLKVGSSEIWRFNLKTDSPHEVRPRIVQTLTDLKIPTTTQGIGGIEAPGGIQFDLLVSKGVILDLKRQLQKLAPKTSESASNSAESVFTDAFTWYKNKSKRKIPEGKTRVVIWLSQM